MSSQKAGSVNVDILQLEECFAIAQNINNNIPLSDAKGLSKIPHQNNWYIMEREIMLATNQKIIHFSISRESMCIFTLLMLLPPIRLRRIKDT